MDNYEINSLNNYLKKQITEMPLILRDEIIYEHQKFNTRNDLDYITPIIDDFLNGENINRYFVIPGIRSVGKTTFLFQTYDYLSIEKHVNPTQILYISCDKLNRIADCDILKTVEYYLENFHYSTLRTLDKEIFLLIDDVQYDKNWSSAGKIIYDESKKIFSVFTGTSVLNLNYTCEGSRRLLKNTLSPLNYSEHLKLKYNYNTSNISKELFNLLFSGETDNAERLEKNINTDLLNLKNYTSLDWSQYLKFGGFPGTIHETDSGKICKKLYNHVEDIITRDLRSLGNINTENENQILRMLNFLANKTPEDVSLNTLSHAVKCPKNTVNLLLGLAEKTQLIFHFEPYVEIKKCCSKLEKYYFASPSIRYALNETFGFSSMPKEYEEILLENLVASALFNAMNNENYFIFETFSDAKNNNSIFLIKKMLDNPIPIEFGHKKTERRLKQTMNKYDSPHGIIISDTTKTIEKDDDVVYIPMKTFSLM